MQDPQQSWSDYHERKKAERAREAHGLWAAMRAAGVQDDTVLALDFTCFGPSARDAESLGAQLKENYQVRVVPGAQAGYHLVEGTTRPHGITLDQERHAAWVGFMFDVARSHGCVLSEWSFEVPASGRIFRSSDLEAE